MVNQRLTTRVLNKLGYKDIQIAHTGLEAIEKFNETFYDVILMDVQMPEMDGLEATRLIRTKQYQQPVIISMTANAMQDDKEKCLAAGMDYYVSKPINLEELVSALMKASESYTAKGQKNGKKNLVIFFPILKTRSCVLLNLSSQRLLKDRNRPPLDD